jgi:hypothetical protein
MIGACVLVFNCYQTYRNGQRSKGIATELNQVKAQTNGLSAHLVKITGETEFARGLKQGEAHFQ